MCTHNPSPFKNIYNIQQNPLICCFRSEITHDHMLPATLPPFAYDQSNTVNTFAFSCTLYFPPSQSHSILQLSLLCFLAVNIWTFAKADLHLLWQTELNWSCCLSSLLIYLINHERLLKQADTEYFLRCCLCLLSALHCWLSSYLQQDICPTCLILLQQNLVVKTMFSTIVVPTLSGLWLHKSKLLHSMYTSGSTKNYLFKSFQSCKD